MDTSIRVQLWLIRALFLVSFFASLKQGIAAEPVRYVDPQESDGSSAAVVVPDVPLELTRQFLPFDGPEALPENGGVREQIERVLDQALKGRGSIVKLNVVAANQDTADGVRQAVAARFAGSNAKPAVSYVIGKLRDPAAVVGIDAVAIRGEKEVKSVISSPNEAGQGSAVSASVPAGPKVYVSGQAERGSDMPEMTRRTLESLAATLKHLGLGPDDVAQIKSFVGPIEDADAARREIETFFKPHVPPLVFVEWTTLRSIEIELVASAVKTPGPRDATVEFVTPPGMTASPVFSRVARVAAGPTIYISGLYGKSRNSPEQETLEIFDQLGSLLRKTGSDFRHLAKATYYVSTDQASGKLNELRPRFYDPQRPPAASKAPVPGTGREGSTITLDMIAVPWWRLTGEPRVIDAWPGKTPGDVGIPGTETSRIHQSPLVGPTKLITNVTKPTLTVYRPPEDKNTGTAMIICPGGGYWDLYWELEGEEVAAWLNSVGITGIILKYRCPRRPGDVKGEPPLGPLLDAQRAVSIVRSRAAEWKIDPKRIGMVGFSAGGHLALATATRFPKRMYEPIDAIDEIGCRPDFAVLCYSGYLKAKDKGEISAGITIPKDTPPIFLAHASDDNEGYGGSIAEHSAFMYIALKRAGIPAELHIFSTGDHDFGVRQNERLPSSWPQLCLKWLRSNRLLPP